MQSLLKPRIPVFIRLLLIATFFLQPNSTEQRAQNENSLATLVSRVDTVFDQIIASPELIGKFKISDPQLLALKTLQRSVYALTLGPDLIGNKTKDIFRDGYQCTPAQLLQQESVLKSATITHLCGEETWFKLLQLTYPTACTILDVGANRGFVASLMIVLWSGRCGIATEVNPIGISNDIERRGVFPNNRNKFGQCRTGKDQAVPFLCTEIRERNLTTKNKWIRSQSSPHAMHVISFEASSYITKTMNRIIQEWDNKNPPLKQNIDTTTSNNMMSDHSDKGLFNLSSIWMYEHYAVSDNSSDGEVAYFPIQHENFRAGFEGGSLLAFREQRKPANDATTKSYEKVPVISVDSYLKQKGTELFRLGKCAISNTANNLKSMVDILKIDAEGKDIAVLEGALHTLRLGVGAFVFEVNKRTPFIDKIRLFDTWGYSCYAPSRHGLFKLSGGCVSDFIPRSQPSNVFCVSRKYAPLAAIAFDLISFPVVLRLLYRCSSTVIDVTCVERFLKHVVGTTTCRPWPQCLKDIPTS